MEIYNDNSRFISILSDYGFKVTFGNEEDTTFLKKALQALIDSPIPIKTIEFIKNEMNAITIDSRSGIYDIACIDENNNHFIVEMQLSDYPEFIQRMKFYALHRFNTMVKKGAYKFEDLTKIYCIGILAVNIFPSIKQFHNIAVLRNDKNEIIDDQMTFITIELAKFTKQIADIQTDLEKLIYTMKTLHTVTETSQFPAFWDEEWLKKAIHEVDLRAMTVEQKLAFEMAISANALAVKNENKKIEEIRLVDKTETVTNALNMGLTLEQCSILANVSLDFVKNIQEKLHKEK
ncbi:Rpn family recombination-promoting nuclease/putative transposase [Arcicella lustrica]|uniref:Rpn family recombination-promoting nuclease/putative transposase n=1 Tax=Arcicella lustrica TaxID=2984196 RepID=A0ABU5SJP5_9BACT|nr:Rpn family recombination-promoting nuclease/putative transposase [Arcicella sp. DC25W]MEA5427470.1 Rpn family recombination-promoting nuclease/putative transposase [Arcicella sp. DC25W]